MTGTSYTKAKHTNHATADMQHPEAFAFTPTDKQRRAKATLTSAVAEGQVPAGALGFYDAAELVRLTKTPSIHTWTKQPGFLAWFTNTQDFGARLAYLQDLAIEAAEQILTDPDPKAAGAKAGLIKTLLGVEQAKKLKVESMGMEELKSLVLANKHVLVPLLGLSAAPAEVTLPASKETPHG